jgi:cytosine/adenosine deaminase-related metal-dependent hydrolase
MSRVHRAAWVLPIDAPPIRDGWVEVADGRIVSVAGRAANGQQRAPGRARSFDAAHGRLEPVEGRVVILPALVNAHTHLELSWMRGRVPPGDAMPAWAARLIGERMAEDRSASGALSRSAAAVAAIADARASGTGLVGDVCNTLDAWEPLAQSGLSAAVFLELLGFRAADPVALVSAARERLDALQQFDRLRANVVPHAPYSVSPDLFRAIAAAAGDDRLSVHLGESPEEVRFLRDGSGPWRALLERIGAWAPEWQPPRCGPVEYMERLGLLNERLIAVHGVQFDDEELGRLSAHQATIVACPRSNRWTGAGVPPIARFYASGVRVAFGTDSLASVEDLNMFAEIAEVRRLVPAVSARQILKSATLDGAIALGFGAELGSITAGKRADLIAVQIPPETASGEDVEEYLVGGVPPADVAWLDAR